MKGGEGARFNDGWPIYIIPSVAEEGGWTRMDMSASFNQ
jgi:hypothetical protein